MTLAVIMRGGHHAGEPSSFRMDFKLLTSTTVVIKWQKPSDAYSGRGERELDGPVAKTTRSAGAGPRAVCYSPEHGRAAALRAHSAAPSRAAPAALALEFR